MFELEEAKGALQAMSLTWVVLEDYLVVMKSRDVGVNVSVVSLYRVTHQVISNLPLTLM